MQIILLEKVANLGNLGDVVKVKDGFARNFLIPTKQARRATTAAIAEHMNLTQGALFRHFSNKEAIWQTVMESVAERFLAQIDHAAQGIDSALLAMEAIFMSHIHFVTQHPGVPRIIFGELQSEKITQAKRIVQTLI